MYSANSTMIVCCVNALLMFCKIFLIKSSLFTTMVTSHVRIWTDEDRNNKMREESTGEE